ncbi:MAG: UDPGP type 1 family protein, partial [Planctomycetes bacterium]|nr:UDPGP type 1 family protein [Planctomycetota bacterium]
MATKDVVQRTLAAHGQDHLLAFYAQMESPQRAVLLEEIQSVDWDQLGRLIASHVLREPVARDLAAAQPPEILPPAHENPRRYAQARKLGEKLLSEGKVAALTVAGGQDTRLGFDGPKGCFPCTPVTGKPLLTTLAEQILATGRRYGRPVPWYVMTSATNDRAIRAFFAEHGFFGLDEGNVTFFTQGMMPAIGLDGKVLLTDRGRLAMSPNGHGGVLSALVDSGALEAMASLGIEQISYFQVDNPLVKALDPLFIGLHAKAGADMSSKAVPKQSPTERLGTFCVINGKVAVIEYSDLPDAMASRTDPDGRLHFAAGSAGVHMLSRAFVERLNAQGACRLPYHRAVKRVPHLTTDGRRVLPAEPNAVKLEMFVFDALEYADAALILETSRVEEFSPIKNAAGPSSLATSMADQNRRHAEWLEQAGVSVPRDADGIVAAAVEISPLFALDVKELKAKVKGLTIEPGQKLYL